MTRFRLQAALLLSVLVAACTPASEHAREVASRDSRDRLTLGTVQREIREGMSGAEVAAALGAPNMVTSDERRRETWVYDRIATEQVYSNSSGGVNALFLAGVSGRSGASQTTQRALTVIIRFSETGTVRDFTYRSSSF